MLIHSFKVILITANKDLKFLSLGFNPVETTKLRRTIAFAGSSKCDCVVDASVYYYDCWTFTRIRQSKQEHNSMNLEQPNKLPIFILYVTEDWMLFTQPFKISRVWHFASKTCIQSEPHQRIDMYGAPDEKSLPWQSTFKLIPCETLVAPKYGRARVNCHCICDHRFLNRHLIHVKSQY